MRKNIYLEWKSRGVIKDKLELIKKLASVGISEDSIAESLGIAIRTFQKMKSDRSDVNLAYESGKNLLKDSMIANIIKRANGGKTIDEDQYIEETPRGTRKRIIKHTKEHLPDISAAKFILAIYFGKDYSDKKFELDLAEKRLEKQNEEWINGDSKQED